jgi:hypothetical protein
MQFDSWGGSISIMSEVTRLLSAIERGDPQAPNQLLPLVYDELRRLVSTKRQENAMRVPHQMFAS